MKQELPFKVFVHVVHESLFNEDILKASVLVHSTKFNSEGPVQN